VNCVEESAKSMISEQVLRKMEEPEPPCDKFDYNTLTDPDDWKKPSLSYGSNPAVPSFSSALSIDHNEQLGRHVVANRNINTGM
jgi:hypothetical protein